MILGEKIKKLSIKSTIKKVRSLPPGVLIKKAVDKPRQKLINGKLKKKGLANGTYYRMPGDATVKIHKYFQLPESTLLLKAKEEIISVADKYSDHEFNLLGSGWVKVNYDQHPKGVGDYLYKYKSLDYRSAPEISNLIINDSNAGYSGKIASMINPGYALIDWQADFKSGYRWDSKSWYRDISYGSDPGADIKVPWELGRMQHLPILAYAFSMTGNEKYAAEFRNTILDFIAFNPPAFGVQWMTSMDVAIRVSNWLLSYDLFLDAGFQFDEEFVTIFTGSIYSHGRHIIDNPEWSGGMRGNHYLANIAGLLFIAAYIWDSDETISWLASALNELSGEISYQFGSDGGNFEASVPYHFLSAEIVFYCLLITGSLKPEAAAGLEKYISGNGKLRSAFRQAGIKISKGNIYFGRKIIEKINLIAAFCSGSLEINGMITQVGDNDSGFFLKISPLLHQLTPKPCDIYNYRAGVLSIFSALAEASGDKPGVVPDCEYSLSKKALSGNNIFKGLKFPEIIQRSENKTELLEYNNFGIYYYRSASYDVSVRCGGVGQNGKGGHAHNDILSFTMSVNGNPVIADPGTYLYTSDHCMRNLFRSTAMHNTLSVSGREQNVWNKGSKDELFWLDGSNSNPTVEQATDTFFTGFHEAYGEKHFREFHFNGKRLMVTDSCGVHGKKNINFHLHPSVTIETENTDDKPVKVILKSGTSIVELFSENGGFIISDYLFSPCYGLAVASKKLIIQTEDSRVSWGIVVIKV